MRAHACELRNYHSTVKRRHRFSRLIPRRVQPVGRSVRVVAVGYVQRGRSYYYIAVDGGRNEYALAHCGGELEQRGVRKSSAALVEQHVLALSADNPLLFLANRVVYVVGMYAGAVHNRVALVLFSVRRSHLKAFRRLFNAGDASAEREFRAVMRGVFGVGNRHLIRSYDAGRGRVQRGNDFARHLGFHFPDFVAAHYAQAFHAVYLALLLQLLQLFIAVRVEVKHERPVAPKRKVQRFRFALHKPCAEDVEFRLERAGVRVEAGMNDAGVRLACARRHVVALFEHRDFRVERRQLASYRAADYAAADYYDFCHCRLRKYYPSVSVFLRCEGSDRAQKNRGTTKHAFCRSPRLSNSQA